MKKADDRPRRLVPARQRGAEPRLARIGVAIGGMLSLALAIATVVTVVGLRFLHFREFRPEPQLSAGTLYNLLKVAFAVAAGIGGVVALVTAYRRQRVAEFAEERASREHELAARAEQREVTRLFNERFTTAAGQLGHETPAVRLAGVYAMAGLADDWTEQRQTCVDVLCAQLRMPYEPEPATDAPAAAQQAFRAVREVRHTVIRVITARLRPDDHRATTLQDWRGLDFDFSGAVFDGGDFTRAQFTGGMVDFDGVEFTSGGASFDGAQFTGGTVSFRRAQFAGGPVTFHGTQFAGGTVSFDGARLTGGTVSFLRAKFSAGEVSFDGARFAGGGLYFTVAEFTGGTVRFGRAKFAGSEVNFTGAQFAGSEVSFKGAQFTGGTVRFDCTRFTVSTVSFDGAQFTGAVSFLEGTFSAGEVSFTGAHFTGGTVDFGYAHFTGSTVSFDKADFTGGEVKFAGVEFTGGEVTFGRAGFIGGTVSFDHAQFAGGTLSFTGADWSEPPQLPNWDKPPRGVMLPVVGVG